MITRDDLTAGDATLVVETTGTPRFTFKVTAPADWNEMYPLYFIRALSGPAGLATFAYLGVIYPDGRINRTQESRFSKDSLTLAVARWAVQLIWDGREPADATLRLICDREVLSASGVAADAGEEVDVDEEAGPACPICGTPVAEDVCKHVVSSLTPEGGHWAGDLSKVEALETLAERFEEEFSGRFSDQQFRFLCQLFGLRPELLGFLAAAVSEGSPATELPDYLNGLVTESPGYAGSAFCEADGGGTSSCWTTYWAEDADACGAWLDAKLDQTVESVTDLVQTLEAIPPE